MKILNKTAWFPIGALMVLSAPAFATVTIVSLKPSLASPQEIGTSIAWTATATDTNAGPLTFQFNITPPSGTLTLVKDFNVGTLSAGTWTGDPFVWVPTGLEGAYKVEVVAKDFTSGKSGSKTVVFVVNPLVTGTTPVVQKMANPLVALFSAPSCATGSTMRVAFQEQAGKKLLSETSWVACHSPDTMTFEVAGMYPGTAYNMYAQTKTGAKITDGPTLAFTTGAIPAGIPIPKFTVATAAPAADPNPMLLHSFIAFTGQTVYPDMATDLRGDIMWYYYPDGVGDILTRPLQGGGALSIEDGVAWNPNVTADQFLRQIDLAGNIVRETNIGAIQQELIALGSVDGGPCTAITTPAPVGAACTGAFHHEAIQTLPNGYTAALIDVEKIFPPYTQGDTTGLPVDIIGDIILVLNTNWQVVWYWDSFDPTGAGQGYPLLPVSRTAVLDETCGADTSGCPPVLLLDPGFIAPLAHDWIHANSLYYWPAPQDGATGGDIVMSSRHQDFVFKIDYQDGAGTGNILWAMGNGGSFAFINTWNDPWPWFSHQHDVGIQSGGAGQMTIMDNGDTRVSAPPVGLGPNCAPYDCDSRGMALNFSESAMTVTPLVSLDLGSYSTANGSADLLSNGNYFFENALVFVVAQDATFGYSLEIGPTPPAPQIGSSDVVLDLSGSQHYRGWQLPNLYSPPTT